VFWDAMGRCDCHGRVQDATAANPTYWTHNQLDQLDLQVRINSLQPPAAMM
jgi:hypothetical protein